MNTYKALPLLDQNNFKVVVGLNPPINPKENTIWINKKLGGHSSPYIIMEQVSRNKIVSTQNLRFCDKFSKKFVLFHCNECCAKLNY